MAESRKGALFGGIAIGVLAGVWGLTRCLPSSGRAPSSTSSAHAAAKKSHSSWLPWIGNDPKAPAKIVDLYKGPRVTVTVKVQDAEGRPVSGATVEARADEEEYESAGLSDEQYDQLMKEKYPDEIENPDPTPSDSDEKNGGDREGLEDDWRAPPHIAVESGRTDRDGVWTVKMKPDVSLFFWASDGSREGVSTTVYTYVPQPAENDSGSKEASGIEVRIEIAEVGTLAGRVTDDHGRPIAGATLRLSSWNGGDSDETEFIAGGKDPAATLATASDGRYRIPLRTSGAFDLEVHAKGFQSVTKQAVQVLPARETIVDFAMSPSVEITGVVEDDTGKPLADARVFVQGDVRVPNFASTELSTDQDGHFVAEELAPGRFTVAASHEGFRTTEVWDVPAGGAPVTLHLTKGATIHGEVTVAVDYLKTLPQSERPDPGNDDDRPPVDPPASIATGDVYIATAGDEPVPLATGVPRGRQTESPTGSLDSRGRYFTSVSVESDGHGSFDVDGLPAGTYVVTITLGAAVTTIPSVRVYETGVVQVRASLPDRDAGTVRGTLRIADGRPFSEGSVFLYGSLPTGLSAQVDVSGRFSFASVPPGDYMLHAVAMIGGDPNDAGWSSTNGYAPARPVHVTASSVVDVDLVAQFNDSGHSLDDAVATTDGDKAHPDGDETDDWGEPDRSGDAGAHSGGDDWGASSGDDSRVDGWSPDVAIEQIDDGLVVTSAAPTGGKRLYGGDRVTQIDGTTVSADESWQALERLYGRKDSICTITAMRPATGETIVVSLPRVKSPDAGGNMSGSGWE